MKLCDHQESRCLRQLGLQPRDGISFRAELSGMQFCTETRLKRRQLDGKGLGLIRLIPILLSFIIRFKPKPLLQIPPD